MVYLNYTVIDLKEVIVLTKSYVNSLEFNYQKRLLKYKSDISRSCAIVGKVLLFDCIRKNFDTRFQGDSAFSYNRYGKPYLRGNAVDFSISHAGKLVSCVCSNEGSVGMDVESQDRSFKFSFLNSYLKKNGLNYTISSLKDWALLEAVLKCHGTGLSGLSIFSDLIRGLHISEIKGIEGYICMVASSTSMPIVTKQYAMQEIRSLMRRT